MSNLSTRLLAVHTSLQEGGFPHAFGGAIALAYCTHEPRGTRDIDVNVFVGTERSDDVLDAMPSEVVVKKAERIAAARDGQVRLMWEDTPIDLFLDVHEFHRESRKEARDVPFEGTMIPVLGCESLIVFRALFNRTRDWADIEEILAAGGASGREAVKTLQSLLGPAAGAVSRLAGLVH